MQQEHLNLHVVLNEDSIDLRQENLDKGNINSRSPGRESSNQVTLQAQNSEDGRRDSSKTNILKRFASNLYYGQQQANMLQKNKNRLRSPHRNRAASADPRFRRARSPSFSKDAGQTQSDSKFVLERLPHVKPAVASKPSSPYDSNQLEPPKSKSLLNEESKRQSQKTEDSVTYKSFADISSAKFSLNSYIYKCETPSPLNTEQSTLTEEAKVTPKPMDYKELYHTAVADVDNRKKKPAVKLYDAPEIHTDTKEPLATMQRRRKQWDDPRLKEKYSDLLSPVRARKSKSSWILPLATNATPEPCLTCTKCACVGSSPRGSSVFEAYEDIDDNYGKIKWKIYNMMRSNYYLAAFFMIGSLCGLMLVALVVWVLANDIIWSYMNKDEVPTATGFRWLVAYVGGGLLHTIHVALSKIFHMIVMPRNEVFEHSER